MMTKWLKSSVLTARSQTKINCHFFFQKSGRSATICFKSTATWRSPSVCPTLSEPPSFTQKKFMFLSKNIQRWVSVLFQFYDELLEFILDADEKEKLLLSILCRLLSLKNIKWGWASCFLSVFTTKSCSGKKVSVAVFCLSSWQS